MSYAKMMKHANNVRKSKKQKNMNFGFSSLDSNERRLFPVLGSVWYENGQEGKRAEFIQKWHNETKQLLLSGKIKLVDTGDFTDDEIAKILDGKSSRIVFGDKAARAMPSNAIEKNGMDESGVKYNINERVTCPQIATLATAWYCHNKADVNNSVLSFMDGLNDKMERLEIGGILTI